MATTVYKPALSTTGDVTLTGDTTLTGDLTTTGDVTTTGNRTISGDLTVDTNTLHVDSGNNRTAVGTLTPSFDLQVHKSSTPVMCLSNGTGGTTTGLTFSLSGNDGYMDNRLTGDRIYRMGAGQTEAIRILSTGRLDLSNDSVRIKMTKTPASASATGAQGQFAWDANYFYICVSTDAWQRVLHATW